MHFVMDTLKKNLGNFRYEKKEKKWYSSFAYINIGKNKQMNRYRIDLSMTL